MKTRSSNKKIIILSIVSILFVLLNLIFKEQLKSFSLINIIIHNLKILFIIYCLITIANLKVKKVFLGYFLVFIAWVWNFAESLTQSLLSDELLFAFHTVFYELASLLGVVVLAYGIWETLKANRILIERLKDLAYYDPVTNLPNRNAIINAYPFRDDIDSNENSSLKLNQDLINLNRQSALFFLDIDDFKVINDSLGHYYGDILIEEIAGRLKSFIKPDDIIVHLSGDEFLIISYDIEKEEDLQLKAHDIIEEIRRPFSLITKDVHITCSIGIALFPQHGKGMDEVIQKADIAMYKAKNDGKNQIYIYNSVLERQMNRKFHMIGELKNAVKNKEFIVHYQTKASTVDSRITGLEALVRWQNPERGLIYPNDFIPLAEETGIIHEIDIIVLDAVCHQIEKWINEGKKPYNISVNISPLFFNQKNFIETLDLILDKYKFDHSFISIEITENVALKDIELTQQKIYQLKKRNIKVHLDDFGKGYSSLAYIKEYPIDYLKIDKIFVDDIINNKVDQELVKTIVNVSNFLGIKVIFEGVETKEQLLVLQSIGCNEYQGYLLCRPKMIEDIELNFEQN